MSCPTCLFPGEGHFDPCTNKTHGETCTDAKCAAPLSEHIGGKSCVVGTHQPVKNWWDLPTAASAWKDAARGM